MGYPTAVLRLAALVATLLPPAAGGGEAPVAFRIDGGEAWTFEKVVDGVVAAQACDEVVLTSPRDSITVAPHDGRFAARVRLEQGDNDVSAQCRHDGAPRGAPAQQHWRVRLKDAPRAQARIEAGGAQIALDAGASTPAPARVAPVVGYAWRQRDADDPASIAGLPAQGKRLVLTPPASAGEYHVTLRVTDALGRADESTVSFRVQDGRAEPIAADMHPEWVDRAVIYGVEPDLFGSRGFADVTDRLDEIAALGVTTLWLTPITAAPAGDFGYAVTDHFRVRETFGSAADLHRLIDGAHRRGLHVILDLVPNHVSDQHPYAVDARQHGERSPYFGFFARSADGAVAHYFDWRNLDNLDYDAAEVQRMMIEAFSYWVREFDVDGFRVDAAWGPRERAPAFWPRWRAALKRIKPDLLLLAEASARDPYYAGHGFDAAYDWTEKLGEWAWQGAFADPTQTARGLRAAIERTQAVNRSQAPVLRFLDNNDTGARFITRHGVAETRVAAAMLLTLPGLPALYSGDEVGAAFEPYGHPAPIVWNDQHGLRAWYSRLIALRNQHSALRSHALQFVDVPGHDQVLAYLRPATGSEGAMLVLLNFGAAAATFTVPMEVRQALGGTEMVDLLQDGHALAPAAAAGVTLAGYGALILQGR